MVIGIVALIFSFIPCVGQWALLPAIVGLILGALDMVQKKKLGQPRGMAIAGLVLNIITIVISCWWIYAAYAVRGAMEEALRSGMGM